MFEHKIMRNQELMANWQRSLKKAIETNRYDSRYNVIDRALRGGTPRYDVSYDYALRMMYQMATVLAEQKASRYFLSKKQASKIIYHEIHNHSNHRIHTV